jgi:streptogramin lyase
VSKSRWGLGLVLGLVVGSALAAPASAAPVGTITQFSAGITPGSTPAGIAVGADGNLWFTEFFGDRIGRITPAGVVTEFSDGITPGSRPDGITAGPDGNLWFTEAGGRRIGRITTAGVVTEFSTGITGGGLTGITAGPDGNLWFTEEASGLIGRITPSGTVTEFPTLTPHSGPWEIVAGPDGNLWFTEYLADRIGKITTAGVVTEYDHVPDAPREGITAGPDGNLWFTERTDDQVIGRITPGGVVTKFSAGITPGSRPFSIAAGPDGNLWFTEIVGDRIGRITPAGVVTEFSGLAAGSRPNGIVAGPDGNLWFTQQADRIGRISAFATPDGCSTATVTAVTPASGPAGTAVTIGGAGFGCATGVLFGDTPALGFSVDGDGRITARAPDGAPGDVDVRVLTGLTASPIVAAGRFTFIGDPGLIAPAAPDRSAAAAERRLTCARMPTLTGYRLAQARRLLARDGCRVRLIVTGRRPSRGHRRITSQTPKPGTPRYAGDPDASVRFDPRT